MKSELIIDSVELFGNQLLIMYAFCEADSILVVTNSTKTVLDCFQRVDYYFPRETATELFAKLDEIGGSWESDLPEIIITGFNAVMLGSKIKSLLELKSTRLTEFEKILEVQVNEGSFASLLLHDQLLIVFRNNDSEIRVLFLTSSDQVEKQIGIDLFDNYPSSKEILAKMIGESLPRTSEIDPVILVGAPAFLIAKALLYYSYLQIRSLEPKRNPWAEKANLN